ncbi:MAG: hypothetical protein F4X64_12160 [Chloroflexi bacterium]|nr:hypothetical protein [Chloroflexota bacterium]
MAASSINRERYREYAHFLRLSADNLNMSVAPGRLKRLKSQVGGERNKFLLWEVAWVLIALVTLVPMMMLAAVEFGLPLPPSVATRAESLHFQVSNLENALMFSAVIVSAITFPVAIVVAFAPIVTNAGAIGDLEYAHRALKATEKQ